MAQEIIVVPLDQLKKELAETVRTEMEKYHNEPDPPRSDTEYLSRKQAAALLQVSLPTLAKWTKEGIVIGYRISSRIRYKKHELIESLNRIKTLRNK